MGEPSRHPRYAGKKQTPTYVTWLNMKRRCYDPNYPQFDSYGGRGIAVCDRWLSFDNFVDDMGTRPFPTATLERLDVNKGYSPDNVIWLDARFQQRNTSRTIWVVYKGERICLKEVAEREGVPYLPLWKRTQRRGLTLQQALKMAA